MTTTFVVGQRVHTPHGPGTIDHVATGEFTGQYMVRTRLGRMAYSGGDLAPTCPTLLHGDQVRVGNAFYLVVVEDGTPRLLPMGD